MANVKISDLAASTAIASGDVFEVETGGVSKKITDAVLAEFIRDTIGSALVAGSNMTISVNDAGDTITFTAAGGGGGAAVPRHPGFVAGRWYRPGPYLQGNAAVTAGVLYAVPLIIPEPVTIAELSQYIVTGASGAPGIKAAIYSNDASSHLPGSKLAEVSLSAATGAQISSAALGTPLVLAAGIYWCVTLYEGTPTIVSTGATDGVISHLIGTPNGNPSRIDNVILYVQTWAAGLPNTFPTTSLGITNSGAPLVFIKPQ